MLGPTASSATATACPTCHYHFFSSSHSLQLLIHSSWKDQHTPSPIHKIDLIDRPCMASLGMLTINATPHVRRGGRPRPEIAVPRPRSYFLCQSRLPSEPPTAGGGGGGGGKKGPSSWAATAERLRGDVVKAGMAARESLSPNGRGTGRTSRS